MIEISEQLFFELEKHGMNAIDRHEVLGTIRVPLYQLPKNKGFEMFIKQIFAGNSLIQLLNAIYKYQLMPKNDLLTIVNKLGYDQLISKL